MLEVEPQEFDNVTVYLRYQNLSNNYDDTFALHLSLLGDDGFFYLLAGVDRDWVQMPRLRAEADESMTWEMTYAVPPTTKGLKMIASGGMKALFDLGL